MSELDGKEVWVEHMSMLHEAAGLQNADPSQIIEIDVCDMSKQDEFDLFGKQERTIDCILDMRSVFRNLERGQAQKFIRPQEEFPTPALILRHPHDALSETIVIEALLLPIRTGMVVASIYPRRLGTYPGGLRDRHMTRIRCWLDNYPCVTPPRRAMFDTLHY
jgi:hypothetical protein